MPLVLNVYAESWDTAEMILHQTCNYCIRLLQHIYYLHSPSTLTPDMACYSVADPAHQVVSEGENPELVRQR